MIQHFNTQGILFLKILAAGIAISFIYDIIRFIRKIIPHKPPAIQIEDVLYWVTVLFIIFSFLIRVSSGQIRFFIFFALFCGMLVYLFSVSPHVIKALDIPAIYIRKIFAKSRLLSENVIKKCGNKNKNKKNILHFREKYAKIKVRK